MAYFVVKRFSWGSGKKGYLLNTFLRTLAWFFWKCCMHFSFKWYDYLNKLFLVKNVNYLDNCGFHKSVTYGLFAYLEISFFISGTWWIIWGCITSTSGIRGSWLFEWLGRSCPHCVSTSYGYLYQCTGIRMFKSARSTYGSSYGRLQRC